MRPAESALRSVLRHGYNVVIVRKDFAQLDWNAMIEDDLRQIVRLAVREDLDRGYDWTTVALVDPDAKGRAAVVARQGGVIAGMRAVPVVIDEMQASIEFQPRAVDGEQVVGGAVVAELAGSARDMLTCERPLLNLVGRLSGIATLTSEYVRRVAGTGARIYDTRKTIPGWRRLEKYAVRCGGGCNHRTGLYDAILIKDNHLAFAAEKNCSPADAVLRAREFANSLIAEVGLTGMVVEVEVDGLDQLDDVLRAGPDIILLDNMRADDMRAAVGRRNEIAPQVELEASGGVSLETVREIALTGVERISCGGLTHMVRWLDVALDWIRPSDR
jgi:nicotinate-nucleotide pyrophosphorylase (carboxylating)